MLRSKSDAGVKMRMHQRNHMENAELLEMLNEEDDKDVVADVRQLCRIAYSPMPIRHTSYCL
jgi:hypothetical protein